MHQEHIESISSISAYREAELEHLIDERRVEHRVCKSRSYQPTHQRWISTGFSIFIILCPYWVSTAAGHLYSTTTWRKSKVCLWFWQERVRDVYTPSNVLSMLNSRSADLPPKARAVLEDNKVHHTQCPWMFLTQLLNSTPMHKLSGRKDKSQPKFALAQCRSQSLVQRKVFPHNFLNFFQGLQ